MLLMYSNIAYPLTCTYNMYMLMTKSFSYQFVMSAFRVQSHLLATLFKSFCSIFVFFVWST